MPNNYYTNPALFIQGDIIRPEDVDAEFNLLEGAFDQLPTQVEIKTGSANYAVDTGVADAYVVDLPYVPTLADGLEINFKAANASTGSSTLNVNSTGVKAVIHPDGTSVIADTISAGGMIQVRYNGASYVMVSVGKGYMEQVTAANVALTNADVVLTGLDLGLTNADVVLTNADVVTAGNSVAVAASHANAAAAVYDQFDDRYLGDKATPPTLDNDGNTLLTGSLYWDTSSDAMLAYNGSAWLIAYTPATGLLSNLVEDTSPQLGGDLDLNGHVITDLVVSDTSPQLGGDLDLNGNKILGFSSIPTQAVIMAYINI